MTSPCPSDAELWSAIRQGDPAALTTLYERHAPAIFNYCYQRLSSRTDAEDVTAEVFTTALTARARVLIFPDVGMRPWLFGVANNLLRRAASSRSAHLRLTTKLSAHLTETPDVAEDLVDAAEDHYFLGLLSTILTQLPPTDREIIQLCVLQGLSPATVATVTNSRPGTVRSRLSRALARARQRLAERLMEQEQSERPMSERTL